MNLALEGKLKVCLDFNILNLNIKENIQVMNCLGKERIVQLCVVTHTCDPRYSGG